ncbi:hypothetical protein ACFFX1_28280 [Dactylosporangium sucinum]|uniref:Uncharacterized protein n=1 Tax=Dactylosporangium sucinum TaxID=1424081 RepID=A0A917X3I6_9ACTN|nr:hypothetical protein [Dactylosporangium sucinum]GGM60822.1 hypothetical protein GCM10007977_072920 [Dactylosporangium sucinum]
MDAELVALASSAASALVGAMASDGWQALRSRVARLLGRGDARAEQVALETLDEDAAGLRPGTERDVASAWTVRLRDLLRADPGAAEGLRELLMVPGGGVTASGSAVAAGGDVRIQAAYGGVAAGTINGSVSTGGPSQPGTDRA